MIGKAYRDKSDEYRARVFQRNDGRWDYEVLKRWPGGGWGVACEPAKLDEPAFADEARALLQADTWGTRIPIDVTELTEGWPGLPPPYEAPEGAPEIEPGQIWRRGQQVLVVESVEPGERRGLRVTTRNIESARPSVGTMIRNRRSAAWTYDEETFRAKFKLDCCAADTVDRERPVTKRRPRRGGSRG